VPFLNYQETRRLHDHVWSGGARAVFRLEAKWSATLSLRFDEEHNTEYALGVQRRL